jgi:DNA-binding NarL/FixJ family response regulator
MGLRMALAGASDLTLVGEAGDGRVALQMILELKPDVAVLDLRLPELTGLEVLAELAQRAVRLPVLMLSGVAAIEHVQQARAFGAFGFLTKDASPEQLLHAVRETAARRQVWTLEQRTAFAAAGKRPTLSPREMEVLRELATGASNKEIAGRMNLSDGTVRIHVSNIFAKLDVDDRTAAVTLGLKRGLIDLP